MHASKITTKGQVTIPLEFRKLLGVRPGDKIAFDVNENGKVLIRKIDSRVSLAGILSHQISKKASDEEIDAAICHGWTNSECD